MAETSIKATSNSIGTGNFTINEVVSDVLQSGDVIDLTIINRLEYYDSEYVDLTEWEESECTYLGGFIFSRDVVKSSSANNILVDFSEGTKTVSISIPTAIEIRNIANVIFMANGSLFIGNTVANLIANSTLIQIANSTSIANLTPASLVIGTSTINSTIIATGANVIISTVALKIGNSTVNTISNSTLIQVANSSSNVQITSTSININGGVVLYGSGTPAMAAGKGSLYLNSAGSNTTNRAFINSDGSTGWTAIVTVG